MSDLEMQQRQRIEKKEDEDDDEETKKNKETETEHVFNNVGQQQQQQEHTTGQHYLSDPSMAFAGLRRAISQVSMLVVKATNSSEAAWREECQKYVCVILAPRIPLHNYNIHMSYCDFIQLL